MYGGKRVLGLITARGGSKGIPGKNIKYLAGVPLIEWTIRAAKKSKYIDRLVISTDDNAIASVASGLGCDVPFMRPSILARDASTSMDVIFHALDSLSEKYDYLLLLQPTSPFRTVDHIDAIIEQTIGAQVALSISVCKVKKHPAFFFNIEHGLLFPYEESVLQKRRQEMPDLYEHNGALYMADISYLTRTKSFGGPGAKAFVMDPLSSIDLDDSLDWELAELVVMRGLVK